MGPLHLSAESILWALCVGLFSLVCGVSGYLIKRTYERVEKRIDAIEQLLFNIAKDVSRDMAVFHTELKWVHKIASDKRSSEPSGTGSAS